MNDEQRIARLEAEVAILREIVWAMQARVGRVRMR